MQGIFAAFVGCKSQNVHARDLCFSVYSRGNGVYDLNTIDFVSNAGFVFFKVCRPIFALLEKILFHLGLQGIIGTDCNSHLEGFGTF